MRIQPIRWMVYCLLLGSLAGLPVFSAEIPDSPVGKAFAKWIEVLRSGDSEAAARHYDETFADTFKEAVPAEQYMAILGQVRTMLEGVELARVVAHDEHNLAAFAESSGGWLQFSMQVQAEAPHRITGLRVKPSEAPKVSQKE